MTQTVAHWDKGFSAAQIGRWWFKNRSLSPLPFVLLMVFLTPDFTPGVPAGLLFFLLAFGAEALRVWAVGYAGSATRTRGDTVPELVHVGPYLYVRNPLYIANILLYTSLGVFFGFTYLSAFIFLYSLVQYSFIIRFEESILETTFGESYRDYCRRVPRWIPTGRSSAPKSRHTFDLKRALRSERGTFYSLAGITLIYVAKLYFTS